MATRRAFLAGLAAASLPRPVWADVGSPAYLAAAKTGEDTFALHGLSALGESLFAIPLPARGHAGCAHPSAAVCVAFARRPGTYALVLDAFSGTVQHHLTPPENRHFNGHGTYSADGSTLFTVEQDRADSTGYLGLWETQTYTRIGEVLSHGIGPHDIKRLPGGGLIIANGGIATDATDRTKLNLDTMRANLTHLDSAGRLLDSVALPPDMQQNSVRHLALIAGGVAFALQWEGDPAEPVPLLGLWRDGTLTLHAAPIADALQMQGYAGSIAASDDRIALTSSHGGVIQLYTNDGRFIASIPRADASGVATADHGFIVTDGSGTLLGLDTAGLTPLRTAPLAWDNHLVALT